AIEAGIFTGIDIDASLNMSHLFYADDAVFIGEWSIANILETVTTAAQNLGCSTMTTPFKYLGIMAHTFKSVFGSTPIYNMSIYKVPESVLHTLESIRRNFFFGAECDKRKIMWVKWSKVLASKKYGGLGVSSFYALNRALLFRIPSFGKCICSKIVSLT
nr:hypothetical protein [Tanacetum cinerariifolium]